MTENNCCCRTKERSEKEFKDLMNRLKRIEGQVKGVQRMLEDHRGTYRNSEEGNEINGTV